MQLKNENEMLQLIIEQYKQEGYELYIHPSRSLLPNFIGNYLPDAIALKNGKRIVIEILSQNDSSTKKMEEISNLFKGHNDWEFKVYWTHSIKSSHLTKQKPKQIEAEINNAENLLQSKNNQAALLLCWAVFEALGRVLMTDTFNKPQSPARLIEILAREGYIKPSEADLLRIYADKRNKFIHGELDTIISESDVETFIPILKTLAKEAHNSKKNDV